MGHLYPKSDIPSKAEFQQLYCVPKEEINMVQMVFQTYLFLCHLLWT